jgi:hypothetical protein
VVAHLRQELMPALCAFYHMTPDQFWDIEEIDRAALLGYMARVAQARDGQGG